MTGRTFLTVFILGLLTITPFSFALDPQKKVTQYVHDSWGVEDGLLQRKVYAIIQTRDCYMWLGTEDGLVRFDGVRFLVYGKRNLDQTSDSSRTRKLLEDRQGNLWIVTFAGSLKCMKDGELTTYTTKDGLSNDFVFTIYEDREGCLWIGTLSGLNCLRDGKFASYTTKDGMSDDRVLTIYEDREGKLWIGTGGGLNCLRDGKFTSFITKDGLSDDRVFTIYEDRGGNLWIGTFNGLNRMSDGKITSYTTKNGLSEGFVTTIYEDREGNLWIGTVNGLNRVNDGKFASFTAKDGLTDDRVYSIYEDREGSLWIGTGGGLNRLKDGKFTSFTTKDGLSNDYICSIYEDREGIMWIGTAEGLNRLKDRKFTPFTVKDGLSNDSVNIIYEDQEGKLWIGTGGGLNHFCDSKFTSFTVKDGLSNDCICSIYEDREGSLWIATLGGLNHLKDGKFESITSKDGLFYDKIYQVLEDDSNNLWMSCDKGIFQVSKLELNDFFAGKRNRVTCISYNERDGMKTRECSGKGQPAGWKSRDGKLWFTTVRGLVTINPNHIKINRILPPVKIEEIIVDNKKIQPPFNSNGKKLVLTPGKERFEIHYTGLSLLVPERVQFKFKLEGFDEKWQDVGTRRTAYYTKLPPGNYTFRVTACNNDWVWNETGAFVSFYLQPYFYQTIWFYFLAALFVLLSTFSLYRLKVRKLKNREKELGSLVELRTRDLKKRNIELENARQKIQLSKELIEAKSLQLESQTVKLKEQAEKLKEMDKVKSRFFANISHEFRTPLTLIMGPLEQMLSKCRGKEQKKKLNLMLRNSQRLFTLINQLLELSKFDSGKVKLHVCRQNIIPFLKGIIASFDPVVSKNDLDLTFHAEEDNMTLYFDPEKLEQVILNLLANAVKFTPVGGRITLNVSKSFSKEESFPAGSVNISVYDNGPGIFRDQLSHIFNRFYQSENTYEHNHKGSGIGLAIAKEIVELHHGRIDVHSLEGKGTEFIIRLPAGDAHLEPDEIVEPSEEEYEHNGPGEIPALYIPGDEKEQEKAAHEAAIEKNGENIILVVEDSADVRDYIRGSLEPVYKVIEAANGQEGMQKAQEIIPDLIICDIMMPEPDGYELCRQIKNNITTSHIPIILLTVKASEESIIQGLETGADDYITKPFNTKILCARIKNLIELRSHQQQTLIREMMLRREKMSVSKIDKEFIRELQEVMEKNLSEPEFNVEELKKKLHMSGTSLYRKIQALSGLSPTDFIRTYRLKRAAQLLESGFGSITEVAFEVGFSSRAYFTKCFKEKFNQLPSTYQLSKPD